MSNNKNNRWFTVIVLLLLTANVVTLALLWINKKPDRGFVNSSQQQPPPPGGQVFEFITRELKLDSAQQEAYKKLRDEHQLQVRPLQESIGKAKDDFFDLLKQENVTDPMVENSSRKIGNLEQQHDVFTFRHFQKLRAICNSEQKIKFDSIIQKALKQMRPGRRPGPVVGNGRPDQEKRNEGTAPKPDMRQNIKRPPPADGTEPEGDWPPPPRRSRDEGPPSPNGRMRPPPGEGPPAGMRPPPPTDRGPDRPPAKDSL